MSSFTTAAATMQTISLVAMEEASRRGRRDADLEDLFLALVLSDQAAGTALRSAGITLDRARDAVDEMHSAQLRSLGIDIDEPENRRIVFHETRGYEWTPRALDVLKRAGNKGSGDAASVLRQLLTEPSGLVVELLERLDSSPRAVADALTAAENDGWGAAGDLGARSKKRAPGIAGRADTFIPASIDDVWALLSDPTRMPEWNPNVGSVDWTDDDPAPTVGATWLAVSPDVDPDGKPARVKEGFRRRRIELVESVAPSRIAWRASYPDMARANLNLLTIELHAAPGGTQLRMTTFWPQLGGWRRVVRWPLRPAQRFLAWLSLTQIGGGISRVFR